MSEARIQELVNEWHALNKKRDHSTDAGNRFDSEDAEDSMARIEAELHREGINPGDRKPDKTESSGTRARSKKLPAWVNPTFVKSLNQQDRANFLAWAKSTSK